MTAAQIAELAGYANEFSQRFGQFLHNINPSQTSHIDIYYVEDEELLRWAREYYNTHKSQCGVMGRTIAECDPPVQYGKCGICGKPVP